MIIPKDELARIKELAEKATDVCEAATFFASPSDGFDFDTSEVVEFAEQVIDSVPSILSLVHPLIEAVEKLSEHAHLSNAVLEVCEYHKKDLPQALREKLDFWFEQYKIDEVWGEEE